MLRRAHTYPPYNRQGRSVVPAALGTNTTHRCADREQARSPGRCPASCGAGRPWRRSTWTPPTRTRTRTGRRPRSASPSASPSRARWWRRSPLAKGGARNGRRRKKIKVSACLLVVPAGMGAQRGRAGGAFALFLPHGSVFLALSAESAIHINNHRRNTRRVSPVSKCGGGLVFGF